MIGTNIEGSEKLPETSIFNVPGMEEVFDEVRLGVTKSNPTPAHVYAKQVADDFENAKLGGAFHLYRGKMGFLLGFIAPLLPRWLHEASFVYNLKLNGPFEYLRKKYASGATD